MCMSTPNVSAPPQPQAAQSLQMGSGAADIAKTLSQSGTADPNLLTSIQQAMQQGQVAPQ